MAELKETIQNNVAAAFDGDLKDAVTSFVLSRNNIDGGSFNDDTGEYRKATIEYLETVINGVSYTDGTCRGVYKDLDGEELLNSPEDSTAEIIIIASEIQDSSLNTDDYENFVDINDTSSPHNNNKYKVISAIYDPAGATVKVYLTRRID